jgi:hypothetical protein
MDEITNEFATDATPKLKPKPQRNKAGQFTATGATPKSRRDLLTAAGATALARQIEGYWRDRGYRVQCTVAPVEGGVKKVSIMHVVRSDMVGGWPSRLG